jgi:SAM-dependent methyltransferase
MSVEDTRKTNAAIAAAYDAVPYDTVADEKLDPGRVLGLGAVYGSATGFGDVLDMGCGTGAQLARAGATMRGWLVGVDISVEACRRARCRLAPFGGRAKIFQTDVLDLDAGQLGRFDLVYCVGVIFVVPTEVRGHVLTLIARCLRPGGVAVLGYYAGALDNARARIHRTLRGLAEGESDRTVAVAKARSHLDYLLTALPPGPQRGFLEVAIRETRNLPDVVFYHEVLNQAFEALRTSDIAHTLAGEGVDFASYLAPVPFAALEMPRERATAADGLDASWGSYRHAVFVRGAEAPDLKRGNTVWTTLLVPAAAMDVTKPVPFRAPDRQIIAVRDPVTAAMLMALREKPLPWTEAFVRGVAAAKANGLALAASQESLCLSEFQKLWAHEYVSPLASA